MAPKKHKVERAEFSYPKRTSRALSAELKKRAITLPDKPLTIQEIVSWLEATYREDVLRLNEILASERRQKLFRLDFPPGASGITFTCYDEHNLALAWIGSDGKVHKQVS